MRAVQITRFGGPEVLEIVDVPEPTPGAGQQLYDVSTAGVNFADTHQIENSYLVRPGAAADPRRRVRRHARSAAASAWSACSTAAATPRRSSRTTSSPGRCPTASATSRRWPSSSRARPRGTCCAPARTWPRASRSSSSPAPAASARLAVQLARRWGAGRVIATASSPEKRALAEELGAHATVDPALADDDPKTVHRRPARGQRRQAGRHRAGDDRRQRLRRLAVGARPVRPAGHLRHGRRARRRPPCRRAR